MGLFTNITVWRCVFPFRMSFSHSLATRNQAETLLLCVRTRSGKVGYGQALPRTYLTGETIDTALEAIRTRWWQEISALPFSSCESVDDALGLLLPMYKKADAERLTASYAAVELAVLDAVCQEKNIPARLPNSSHDRIPLVGVVSATSPGKAGWLARAFRLLGYRHFKIKAGNDADGDARRIESVRKIAGNGAWIAIDANQAWEYEEAVRRLQALKAMGVRLVEEPLRSPEPGMLAQLEKESNIPLMADETLCTRADADNAIRHGGPSWWNLRIGKNGGFAGMDCLGKLAAAHSINVYMGVLVGETSMLAAAGRSVMFAAQAKCAEYGFPRLFIKGDPFRGGPGGWNGWCQPPDSTPGFGIAMREQPKHFGHIAWQEDS